MTDTERKNKIITALRSLDKDNANHWTTDGQPRVDTVRMLASDQELSRDDIAAAAPGFSKDTAATWTEPAVDAEGEPTGVPVPNSEEAAEALGVETSGEAGTNVDAEGDPSGVPTPLTEGMVPAPPEADAEDGLKDQDEKLKTEDTPQAPGQAPIVGTDTDAAPRGEGAAEGAQEQAATEPGDGEAEQPEVEGPVDHTDEVEALEAELEALRAHMTEGREARDRINTELGKLAEREHQLHDRLTTLQGPGKPDTAVMEYLASRRAQNERRGDVRQTLKDGGVDLKAIQDAVAPAPIDSAMARKRGRGTQRPVRGVTQGG